MRVDGWSLLRFVHVTSAMVWVGGQLVLAGIVLPILRTQLEPETRGPVVRAAATRFAIVANFVVLPLLLVTGIALAWHRGVTFGTFGHPGYGRLLGTKLVLVVVAIALAAMHGVFTGTRPGTARALAIASLAASLGVVVYATALVP